ncbi:MAG: hypothetical protein N2A97_01035, partial [Thermodesulfobacteriales bacterium]
MAARVIAHYLSVVMEFSTQMSSATTGIMRMATGIMRMAMVRVMVMATMRVAMAALLHVLWKNAGTVFWIRVSSATMGIRILETAAL